MTEFLISKLCRFLVRIEIPNWIIFLIHCSVMNLPLNGNNVLSENKDRYYLNHTFVYVFVNCMYVSSICVSILIHGNVCAEVSRKYKLLLTVSRTNLFEESSIFIISPFNCDQ